MGKGHAHIVQLTNCADLIIAAQAFHWFDLDGTFAEVERICTERSACVAFWNVRLEDTPFIWL